MACRRRADSREMVRIGRHEGGLQLGRGSGRGAWCCEVVSCREGLTISKLSRALRSAVTSEEVISVSAALRTESQALS